MRPRKSPLRATLNEGVTFTTETLRELLQKKVLNSRLRIPSDEALAELARILEVWRPYYLADQSLRPLQREAHAAAQRLSQPLKKMRQLNEEFYTTAMRDAAPAFVLDILKKRLAAIDGAFDSFASLNREQITVEYGDRYKLTWTWLADALPIDFERAMLSTNPSFKAGIGHSGPLTRFIAAIAPILTGEQPTSDSVATLLKKRKNSLGGKLHRTNFPRRPKADE